MEYSNNSYCEAGSLVNLEALRAAAVKRARSRGEATLIHHHAYGAKCKGIHEYVTQDGIREEEL